jgi:hypothetical protein
MVRSVVVVSEMVSSTGGSQQVSAGHSPPVDAAVASKQFDTCKVDCCIFLRDDLREMTRGNRVTSRLRIISRVWVGGN